MMVYKLDAYGNLVWQYPARLLDRQPYYVRLEAYFDREDMDLGYTVLRWGDRFVEYFYTDRWYNVFAVYGGENGRFKGWYCNICRPAVITDNSVSCAELALDLWVAPNGGMLVLDEDEFAALDIPDYDRENGRLALKQLQKLATEDKLPT